VHRIRRSHTVPSCSSTHPSALQHQHSTLQHHCQHSRKAARELPLRSPAAKAALRCTRTYPASDGCVESAEATQYLRAAARIPVPCNISTVPCSITASTAAPKQLCAERTYPASDGCVESAAAAQYLRAAARLPVPCNISTVPCSITASTAASKQLCAVRTYPATDGCVESEPTQYLKQQHASQCLTIKQAAILARLPPLARQHLSLLSSLFRTHTPIGAGGQHGSRAAWQQGSRAADQQHSCSKKKHGPGRGPI
jgi:hypothetical protein